MKYFYGLIMVLTASTVSAESTTISATKSFFVGAASAAVGTVVLEPLFYFKNTLQQQKTIKLNPRIWYRGLPINASGSIPILAIQNMVYGVAKEQCKQVGINNRSQELIAAVSAGVASSPITCVRELLTLQQQNNGGNAYQLLKSFTKQHGYKKLATGLTPTAIRNSSYATCLFVVTPEIKKIMNRHDVTPALQNIAAPALAGVTSALLTHPLDTIKTHMQARVVVQNSTLPAVAENPPHQRQTEIRSISMRQAFWNLYNLRDVKNKQLGIRALYLGLLPRLIGVPTTLIVVSNARDYITKLVDRYT